MKKYFKYIPGTHPLPMIMMFTEENKEAYNDEYKFKYGVWEENKNSIWTIGAYIIFDPNEKKIVSYKFNELSYLIWLLRYLNIDITIEITDENILSEINQNYLSEFEEIL